jgi:hypothetical protein
MNKLAYALLIILSLEVGYLGARLLTLVYGLTVTSMVLILISIIAIVFAATVIWKARP